MTQTSAPVVEQTRRRRFGMSHLNLVISVVALVATVLGTVAAWLALKPASNPSGTPTNSTVTASAPAAAPSQAGTSPAAPSEQLTYLSTLTPVRGGANAVSTLPPKLDQRTDLQNSIVVRCYAGNNQPYTEVQYQTRRNFKRFQAVFEPFMEPTERVKMQVKVFVDPSVENVVSSSEYKALQVGYPGATLEVTADVRDAPFVRLQIGCQDKDGFVVLKDAAFVA